MTKRARHILWRRLRFLFPSCQYLALYCWMFLFMMGMLAGVSWLMGRDLGMDVALAGGLAIGLMMLSVFLSILAAGMLVNLVDRDP